MKLKRLVVTILLAIFALSFALATACESDEFLYEEYFYVSLSIYAGMALRFDTLAQEVRNILPECGYIIPKRDIRIERRTTVLTLLQNELMRDKIQFTARRGYVEGINYLYERAIGTQSGWIFFVNGAFSPVGAGSTVVRANDKIE